jgi:MFS family permease
VPLPPGDRPTRRRRLGAAARGGGRRVGRVTRGGARRLRAAAGAQGADRSGLSRLIEMHAVSAAGDALIAVSLAGTLFFSVPTGEARGNVALYLLVTMLPFVLLAPLIGPTLDRFRNGRRWALGGTLALRGFLCWVMADAVTRDDLSLYPAAFGCLVASKAYSVTRAAAVPRLLPDGITLVTANSRVSLAGVAGAGVAVPVGVGLASLGGEWCLRLAFAVFVVATVLAVRLPARIDSDAGEVGTPLFPGLKRSARISAAVVASLRATASLRLLSGFLTMYLAFVLTEQPVGDLAPTVAIGLVAAAAGLGSTSGTALGSALRLARPDAVVLGLLATATVVTALAGVLYGLPAVLAVALVAGFAQQLGKLCQDAIIQREVAEEVRTSAFARAETLTQLAWVAGGLLGITMPLLPKLGLGVVAALLAGGFALALRAAGQQRRRVG